MRLLDRLRRNVRPLHVLAYAAVFAALGITGGEAGAPKRFSAVGAQADAAEFDPMLAEKPIIPPLMTAEYLQLLMDEATPLQIVDIRRRRARSSLFSYLSGHIPGSSNLPYGEWRKIWADPLEVPGDLALTNIVRRAGLVKSKPVVIVHSSAAKGNFGSAAWVYWVLKSSGFKDLSILDGGIRAWQENGGPLERIARKTAPSGETVRLDPTWLATHEDVDAMLRGESDAQLLDARPLNQIAKRGMLDGATHLNGIALMNGTRGQAGDILSIFERIKQVQIAWGSQDVITYCNNGALAAIDWFMASEIAKIPNVKIYGHSLSARDRAAWIN